VLGVIKAGGRASVQAGSTILLPAAYRGLRLLKNNGVLLTRIEGARRTKGRDSLRIRRDLPGNEPSQLN